jgi:hypothetical protein
VHTAPARRHLFLLRHHKLSLPTPRSPVPFLRQPPPRFPPLARFPARGSPGNLAGLGSAIPAGSPGLCRSVPLPRFGLSSPACLRLADLAPGWGGVRLVWSLGARRGAIGHFWRNRSEFVGSLWFRAAEQEFSRLLLLSSSIAAELVSKS